MDLIERLEEQRTVKAQDCPSVIQLEAYATNGLDSSEKERLDSHLEGCLSCLNVMVELRDLIAGIENPEPLVPSLESRLKNTIFPKSEKVVPSARFNDLIGNHAGDSFGWRDVFGLRVLAGALAGVILTLGAMKIVDIRNQFEQESSLLMRVSENQPIDKKTLETLEKIRSVPKSESIRNIVGIIRSLKKGTMDGFSYYIFEVRTKTGSEYLFFSWGTPEFQVNDRVDVYASIKGLMDKAGTKTGVAKKVRKSGQL